MTRCGGDADTQYVVDALQSFLDDTRNAQQQLRCAYGVDWMRFASAVMDRNARFLTLLEEQTESPQQLRRRNKAPARPRKRSEKNNNKKQQQQQRRRRKTAAAAAPVEQLSDEQRQRRELLREILLKRLHDREASEAAAQAPSVT